MPCKTESLPKKAETKDESGFPLPGVEQRLDFSKSCVVLVGSEETEYNIPICLLTPNSPFFAAACSTRWNDDNNKPTIKLLDFRPGIFNDYLQIVCTKALPTYADYSVEHAYVQDLYKKLLDLFTLANYIQDLKVCNMIIDKWLAVDQKTLEQPSIDYCHLALKLLPSGNPLVRLCTEQLIAYAALEQLYDDVEDDPWPTELTKHALRACLRMFSEDENWDTYQTRPRCYYHEHNDEVPKCG